MRTRTSSALLCAVLLASGPVLGSDRATPGTVLALARAERSLELQAIGGPALPPLLDAYREGDRETRKVVLRALGSLNVKSPAAVATLAVDVDGEDSIFQQLHRYALQVVDPEVRSPDLYEQVSGEGVDLDHELGLGMYATLTATYHPCAEKLAHARRYVAALAAADPQARYAAIVSLRIMTGASHGYHPWVSDAGRTAAVAAWRAWLQTLERTCHD